MINEMPCLALLTNRDKTKLSYSAQVLGTSVQLCSIKGTSLLLKELVITSFQDDT